MKSVLMKLDSKKSTFKWVRVCEFPAKWEFRTFENTSSVGLSIVLH